VKELNQREANSNAVDVSHEALIELEAAEAEAKAAALAAEELAAQEAKRFHFYIHFFERIFSVSC